MGIIPSGSEPSYQESLCDKLETDIDTMLSAVEKAKDAVKPLLDALETSISTTPLADVIDYDNAVAAVNDAITDGEFIPTDVSAIISGIATCPYLNKSPLLNNALATIGTVESEVIAMGRAACNIITGIGQFEIGLQLKGLTDLYAKYGIDTYIPQIQDLIVCIGGFCGRDIGSSAARLLNLKELLSLGEDGTIDVVKILQDGGITDPSDIVDIQGTIEQVDRIDAQIREAVDAAKNLVKPLF